MILHRASLSSRLTARPWAGQNLGGFQSPYLYGGITSPDPPFASCFGGGQMSQHELSRERGKTSASVIPAVWGFQ